VRSLEERCLLSGYQQVNLVGNHPGLARRTDPNLNGWGMDSAPNGPFCVADTATGVATFYTRGGQPLPQVITIPAAPALPPGTPGSPTGVVYNPTSEFVISENGKSAPALFIFDTLDGLVCGWNPAVDTSHALIMVDNSAEAPFAASYTGLVMAQNGKGQNVLYAADSGISPSQSNNRIDMFDGSFQSLGSFTDPNVATNYPGNTAFQVEEIKGKLFVTFGGFTPPFGGVVDVFSTDGKLLTPNHFAANTPGGGPLVNPWAVVQAPADFGPFSKDILIGNVEDGRINAFNPQTGAFLGTLQRQDGTALVIPGLWDLAFRQGSAADDQPPALYFTAGPDFNSFAGNGLFGAIRVAEEGDDGAGAESPARSPVRLADPAAGQDNVLASGDSQLCGQQVQTAAPPLARPAPQSHRPANDWAWDAGTAHGWRTADRLSDQDFACLDGGVLEGVLRADMVAAWAALGAGRVR
jgi:uncharacterized protein (TIGR03118 family)